MRISKVRNIQKALAREIKLGDESKHFLDFLEQDILHQCYDLQVQEAVRDKCIPIVGFKFTHQVKRLLAREGLLKGVVSEPKEGDAASLLSVNKPEFKELSKDTFSDESVSSFFALYESPDEFHPMKFSNAKVCVKGSFIGAKATYSSVVDWMDSDLKVFPDEVFYSEKGVESDFFFSTIGAVEAVYRFLSKNPEGQKVAVEKRWNETSSLTDFVQEDFVQEFFRCTKKLYPEENELISDLQAVFIDLIKAISPKEKVGPRTEKIVDGLLAATKQPPPSSSL